MTNLAVNLTQTAARHPDRPALRLGDTTLTYAEFDALAGRAAGRMAELGIGEGSRVGLMLPNLLEFPVLFYGALRLGAIVVPMNPLLRGREIEHYVGDSAMQLLWVHDSVAPGDLAGIEDRVTVRRVDGELLSSLSGADPAPFVDREPFDTAVILYTSGTTGTPKGAELTHAGLDRNLRIVVEDLVQITETDVIMGCLPLFHVFGLTCALNTSVAAGALVTLVARFDAQTVLDVIEHDGVTIFQGVPTMYTALAALPTATPEKVATLRLCCSGGASLPAEVLRAFETTYGAQVLEGYGLSETSPVASFNRVEDARVGSIGTPIPGVEFKVIGHDGA
jgi:long-chain acyl-CoA synthetase